MFSASEEFMNNAKKYLVILLLLCAVVVIGAWGISVNMKNDELTKALGTTLAGDFEEFYDDMALMSEFLEKCTESNDPAYIVNMLSSAGERAASAKEALSRLPVAQQYAGGVQALLSKGEQFSKAALRDYLAGNDLDQKDKNSILAIATASEVFLEKLSGFYDDLDRENYSFIKLNASEAFMSAEDELSESLKKMGEDISDLPDINYDGRYSSHMDPSEYKGISGNEADKEDIRKTLEENIGEGWNVEYSGEGKGNLPTHSFTATDGKNTMHVTYSRQGGNLLLATSENYPDRSKISCDEAFLSADRFVEKLGHSGMDEEYYEIYNNILSVTYAYSENGIKCLSDTLTVQVSMKDGKILGYEADKYYKNHTKRDPATPSVSVEEARNAISENMDIISSSLCYLPTEGGYENLCYEFLCERDDDSYLIYIDAQNGRQREMKKVSVGENMFKVR